MKNLGGFVKIYRNLPKWRWYSDDITFRVFMHLLLTAQYKDTPWQERVLREGQAVTGSQKLADDLGLSRQQVRTALRKLQATNSITIETTNKYSVITVTNWQKYQKDECSAADTSTKALTDEQPTDNHRATNDQPLFKKEKKDKKEKNERERALAPNGTFGNVLLTEKELEALRRRYPVHCDEKINRLSRWLENKPGRNYRNHYALLLDWLEEDVGTEEPVTSSSAYDIDELDKINTLEGY